MAKPTAADRNLTWQAGGVSQAARRRLLGQRGCVLWLTGLSGSGKSTLATALEKRLIRQGRLAYVLDGDNIRHGLNADLGFKPADRVENLRRIGQVAALFADAGLIAITAFISPYRSTREAARSAAGPGRFLEVFCHAPLAVCEGRDTKGLYRRARAGELKDFTGIDAPYESPRSPDLLLDTANTSVAACVRRLEQLLRDRKIIRGRSPS
ncbi:MAG: adenylyl-sulfate kinase [Phycisphaerae bacterium]|nr:adenylyl-sulfate kinase [Phycisphaerae bacterium]